ncbi:hypothetical protein BGX24_010564 [Mortierella sp. AD032]|nr:hypothetical protein BGX24_010564 [Mortierella sp. AD032]
MQQQQHALDIPVILALVGSFLPLWDPTPPNESNSWTHVFLPKTLASCLQVSKLWHRSLLPILWYGYWAYSMEMTVPEDVVVRYSHLFRIVDGKLDWRQGGQRDFTLFKCKNLVELHATVVDNEGPAGVKRLLRTNPGIKTLTWKGIERMDGETEIIPVLDAEDFEGLTGLESLNLKVWDCSGNGGRQLRQILRLVGGSLKELRLASTYDVSPEVLSTSGLLSSSQQGEEDLPSESLQLPNLESLHLGDCGDLHLCAAELVKCCPKLKKLRYGAHYCDKSVIRLAISLERHCPKLESLKLDRPLGLCLLKRWIRYCGRHLRTLHFHVVSFEHDYFKEDHGDCRDEDDLGQDLISTIVEHSGKLEDIHLYTIHSGLDPGVPVSQLLVGCTKLRRFMTNLSGVASEDLKFLEVLKCQQWKGCQESLEELKFECNWWSNAPDAVWKKIRRIGCEMGWVDEDTREDGEGESESEGEDEGGKSPRGRHSIDEDTFRKLLEVVQFQELKALKRLDVVGRVFRRKA